MKEIIIQNPILKSIIFTMLVLVFIFLPLNIIANNNFTYYLLERKRADINEDLSVYTSALDKAISSRTSLIYGLEGFVLSNKHSIEQEKFELFASGLVMSAGGIRNVILAPNGVNGFVYPIEGNEVAIGHDLINDEREDVRKVVKEAIKSRELISSGPYALRQGGTGIVFRKALYFGDEFWGLASFVIDFDSLLELTSLNHEESNICMTVYNKAYVFCGEYELLDNDPVIQSVILPNGTIEIAAMPTGGWEKAIRGQLVLVRTFIALISLLISCIFFIISFVNIKMQNTIKSKVNQLQDVHNMLRVKQNLESIGTLANGVAHEINNPLNGILNYAQLIKDSTDKKNINYEYSNEIIKESSRVSKIVKSLLSFSRRNGSEFAVIRLDKLFSQVLVMINTIIKLDKITLETYPCKHLPYVKCNQQQIQQVILNLLTNARYALNHKYKGYHENKIMKIYCTTTKKNNDEYVRVTIEDHGEGISKTAQAKIFEPFFTTKGRFEGTGLGLSICYGIAKDHDGELSFDTKEGEYTKFYLDLPVVNDEEKE